MPNPSTFNASPTVTVTTLTRGSLVLTHAQLLDVLRKIWGEIPEDAKVDATIDDISEELLDIKVEWTHVDES